MTIKKDDTDHLFKWKKENDGKKGANFTLNPINQGVQIKSYIIKSIKINIELLKVNKFI